MSPADAVRVRHMIDAIEAARRFAAGRDRSHLDTDQMLLFALVRAVEIVGEAAGKMSTDARAELPEVPWVAAGELRSDGRIRLLGQRRAARWLPATDTMEQ